MALEPPYEVLQFEEEASHEARLGASYTPSNGIRIEIINQFGEEDADVEMLTADRWDNYCRVFDLTAEQARQIGGALIRWADGVDKEKLAAREIMKK